MLGAELEADRAAGEQPDGRAARLRRPRVPGPLRGSSSAARRSPAARSAPSRRATRSADAAGRLERCAGKLGLEAEPAAEPLPDAEREALAGRIERLRRRREQLGPVNPLAQDQYREALEHVEELEAQREDLEAALRELKGLIRDTDRRIQEAFEETFAAAADNFEEVAEQLFPGGRGRLRLVREDGPRAVLGGAPDEQAADAEERADAEAEAEATARAPATTSASRSRSPPPARPPSACRCCRAARSR